jgi:hypothetical protein
VEIISAAQLLVHLQVQSSLTSGWETGAASHRVSSIFRSAREGSFAE